MLGKCLLLLAVLYGVAAQKTYMITLSNVIRPGLDMNILVNILEANRPVTVTVSLWKRVLPPPPVAIQPVPILVPQDILVENVPILPIQTATEERILETQSVVREGEPKTISLKLPDTLPSANYFVFVHGSGGLTFQDRQNLRFQPTSLAVFTQTDKGIYRPGQKVLFRTFAVYPDLKPYLGTFDIGIYDGNGNKIKQLERVQGPAGVYSDEFTLSDQPVMGQWKIEAEAVGMVERTTIRVEQFVLPKFEVTVNVPEFGLVTDTDLVGTVEAKYTFGKAVDGRVVLRVRKNFFNSFGFPKCTEPIVEKQLTLNGKTQFRVSAEELAFLGTQCNGEPRFRSPGEPTLGFLRATVIKVEADVTESLTGITQTGEDKIQYSEKEFRLQWLSSNSKNFKPGLWYDAFLQVSRMDGTPIPLNGQSLFVTLNAVATFSDGCGALELIPGQDPVPVPTPTVFPELRMVVPQSGIIFWSNIVPKGSAKVSLIASFSGAFNATLRVDKMDSPSKNFLQALLLTPEPTAGEPAQFRILSTAPLGTLIYQIISRGIVIRTIQIDGGNRTTFFESVSITNQMGPSSKLVIYTVLPSGEVLADSVNFNVEGVYANNVSVELSTVEAQPGDTIQLTVNSDPNSLVNILAVDQSVLLLSKGNDISRERVSQKMTAFDGHSPFGGAGFSRFPIPFSGGDVTSIFRNAGITVLTDALLHVAKNCRFFNRMDKLPLAAVSPTNKQSVAVPDGDALVEPDRVRTLFPDTWLWASQTVGSDGRAVFNATVPDTITSWVTGAFAMNTASGLGIAPTNPKMNVFLPFFITLNLPATVVRGEEVIVQAIVFNFFSLDLRVRVRLAASSDFQNIELDSNGQTIRRSVDKEETIQTKAGEAVSVFFPIVATSLGSIDLSIRARSAVAADALVRQLRVEPEGVSQEYNLPLLVDLTRQGATLTETLPIPFPANVVPGSQRVTVNVLGDLLGPTINNLDKLLKMPTGCGEQNMVNFAPDVFILKYLTETNQLSNEIRDKATRFLEQGYQRELSYQRSDGSFSAFGNGDDSGSMWLTAFVVKSFCEAKPFTFIDDNVVNRAIDWIVTKQSKDGSFPEVGKVIHTEMQGGSGKGPALTAYVLAAISGKEDLTSNPVSRARRHFGINQARGFLETAIGRVSDIYAISIAAYALQRVNSNVADRAFVALNEQATTSDGGKFWDVPIRPTTEAKMAGFWEPPHQPRSQNVEATSYALLNLALRANTAEGLPVVRWLAQQRNADGGFVSTQDTVVALEALSEFAGLIYTPNSNVNIGVKSISFDGQFTVSQATSLILQSAEIPGPPSSVTISASGSGTAIVQVTVAYNVFRDSQQPAFDVRVDLKNETINGFILQTCATNRRSGESGMVIQETGIPTGFAVDENSISVLELASRNSAKVLKRTETLDRKVVLYFDEVGTNPVCISMKVNRVGLVAKSQAVPVKVYKYYSPQEQKTEFYQSQLLSDSNFCDICVDCGCPAK